MGAAVAAKLLQMVETRIPEGSPEAKVAADLRPYEYHVSEDIATSVELHGSKLRCVAARHHIVFIVALVAAALLSLFFDPEPTPGRRDDVESMNSPPAAVRLIGALGPVDRPPVEVVEPLFRGSRRAALRTLY
jgi:hypothetical protein